MTQPRTPLASADSDEVFSRRQALALGETTDTLRASCRSGAVVRLRRGFYVAGDIYRASGPVERHLLHAQAEVRAQDGEVALCSVSAAALRGLELHDQDLSVVHLLRLDNGAAHRTRTVHHHRVLQPAATQVEIKAGVRVVSEAQAVWEVACQSSLESGVVTADSALRRGSAVRDRWIELADRFQHVPGSHRARLALRLARDASESAGESVTRVQCFRYGIPEPELQHKVINQAGRLLARTDFWWEEFRHVGEFDGRIKYGRLLLPAEKTEDAVVREKQREDDVRGENCGMSRFTWSTVMPDRARRTMAELAHALERSRRLYVVGVRRAG
ncbi:MAG: hypothetical protein ACRYG2_03875 [Janthinobacterium lividum]